MTVTGYCPGKPRLAPFPKRRFRGYNSPLSRFKPGHSRRQRQSGLMLGMRARYGLTALAEIRPPLTEILAALEA